MNIRLLQKNKILLLRGAAKRGLQPFLRQTYLISMDLLLREKHLVFQVDATDVMKIQIHNTYGLTVREITSWESLLAIVRQQSSVTPNFLNLGNPEWLKLGWRLWIGELNGHLACLGWLRSAEQSADFFCPMSENSELLWHVTVLPEFRGRSFHVLLWLAIMRLRMPEGVARFYTNCREYNIPSRCNIRKAGLHCIGFSRYSKITKRRTWHPAAR